MKRPISLIFAVVFSLSNLVSAQEVLDGIAAVVNNDVVTFSQVREVVGAEERAVRATLREPELKKKITEIRTRAINDLIDRQLILQEFKKQKFNIPSHFVDEQVSRIVTDRFGGDRAAFIRTLNAQGVTLERFKANEQDRMVVSEMRRQAVRTDGIVAEDKINAFYKKNIELYSDDPQVRLRMITIRQGDPNGRNRRKLAEEILQRAKSGTEFASLARLYSEDSSQESGGDWGWINQRTLNPALTMVAFNLKPKTVSPIVEATGSYYILYVEEKKLGKVKPLSEVRNEIKARILQEDRTKREADWLARLRKKAFIKIY